MHNECRSLTSYVTQNRLQCTKIMSCRKVNIIPCSALAEAKLEHGMGEHVLCTSVDTVDGKYEGTTNKRCIEHTDMSITRNKLTGI